MAPNMFVILLKMLRRSARISTMPHIFLVLLSFSRNYARLVLWRFFSGRCSTLAIALVEHMGDIIAAEPVSRFAKKEFPNFKLLWIVTRPYAEIVRSYNSVDKVVIVTCMTEWLLLWASKYNDIVWDLHISERPCPQCHISVRKTGLPGQVTRETYYNFGNLLTVNCLSAGIKPLAEGPIIRPSDAVVNRVDELSLPKSFVVIHCSSNERNREWTSEKWRALVSWIVDKIGLDVFEVGTSPCVTEPDSCHMRSLCGTLSMLETAEVIRRATLFIGIDSGPAHLANAVGTPGVIMLGQYQSFRSYTPYSGSYADGAAADLIRTDGLVEAIPVERVVGAVAKRLGSELPL